MWLNVPYRYSTHFAAMFCVARFTVSQVLCIFMVQMQVKATFNAVLKIITTFRTKRLITATAYVALS